MRLISCYIENFGGLSGFRLDFEPGLTTLQRPNGFGKTTLAEFIRAMFYGFPRASQKLQKNPRKRYAPWQGGTFGGSLVFETGGNRYRIERTFGHTPRTDSFRVFDLQTNRPTDRFSPEIGQELFQLDGDSFARSTYLPQLHEGLELSTDGIRAKLGDLVEDTDDIRNFDSAMEALRTKRTALELYRGSGGKIPELRSRISRQQQELSRLQGLLPELQEARQEREALEDELGDLSRQLQETRQAAQQSARQELLAQKARQLSELQKELDQARSREQAINAAYPGGIPTEQELDAAGELLRQEAAAIHQLEGLPVPRAQMRLLEENQSRFRDGVPDGKAIARCRELCGDYMRTESALTGSGLSPRERDQLSGLERRFSPRCPDRAFLDSCRDTQKQITLLRDRQEQAELSSQEQVRLQMLEKFFPEGAPDEQALQKHRQLLAARKPASPSPLPPILLILGLLLLVPAALLLARASYAPGGALCAAALVLLAAALLLKLWKKTGSSQGETLDFLRSYSAAYEADRESLEDLSRRVQEYRTLCSRQAALAEKRRELEAHKSQLEASLRASLLPFFPEGLPPEPLSRLQEALSAYESLSRREQEAGQDRQQKQNRLDSLGQTITEFLSRYFDQPEPEQFLMLTGLLQQDSDLYVQAQKDVEEYGARSRQMNADRQDCRRRLDTFTDNFSLPPLTAQSLQALRQAGFELQNLYNRLSQLEGQQKTLLAESPELGEMDVSPAEAPEAIRNRSARLEARRETLLGRRQALLHRLRLLTEETDAIPEQQDALEALQQELAAAIHSRELLDKTMALLTRARESLSCRYLGGVQEKFRRYMALLEETPQSPTVSPDLEIRLERSGMARELDYFSVGQADLVMLCMRLALADALYEDQPLIILDDPFVNLDDSHTEKALALLDKLSKTHQILYLTCHSSRV